MSRTALLVEPDPSRARLTHAILDIAGGWELAQAASLDEAAAAYAAHPTDVVVLHLAGHPGPRSRVEAGVHHAQLLAPLQHVMTWLPQPAVLVVTDGGDDELGRAAVDQGAQDFLRRDEVTPGVLPRVMDFAVRRHLAVVRAGNREAIATARANALSAYAMAVSHDLRSPLASLISMADMVRTMADESTVLTHACSTNTTAEASEEIETLLSAITRVEALGRRALAFTDTLLEDAEQGAASRTRLDFGSLIAEAWQLAGSAGITLSIGELPTSVYGLEAATRQVLVNLLSNAVHHLVDRRGHIRVTATEAAGAIRLLVHDNGPGVSEELRLAIFEPGISGRGSTGTGLTTVLRQMERQGGRAWVEASTELSGSAFVLEFPSRDSSRVMATRRAMRASAQLAALGHPVTGPDRRRSHAMRQPASDEVSTTIVLDEVG